MAQHSVDNDFRFVCSPKIRFLFEIHARTFVATRRRKAFTIIATRGRASSSFACGTVVRGSSERFSSFTKRVRLRFSDDKLFLIWKEGLTAKFHDEFEEWKARTVHFHGKF